MLLEVEGNYTWLSQFLPQNRRQSIRSTEGSLAHPLRLKQEEVTTGLEKDSCRWGMKLWERKADGLDFLMKSEANFSAEGIIHLLLFLLDQIPNIKL